VAQQPNDLSGPNHEGHIPGSKKIAISACQSICFNHSDSTVCVRSDLKRGI